VHFVWRQVGQYRGLEVNGVVDVLAEEKRVFTNRVIEEIFENERDNNWTISRLALEWLPSIGA
jgi:hypothetical protein